MPVLRSSLPSVLPWSNPLGSRCLLSSRLKFHPQQAKQVQPKNVHKMPIARGRIQRVPSQGRLTQLANDIDQPAQPTQYMQRMGGRKHIEKGTTGVRGQIEPLGAQLQPRDVLASHKKQAEDERYVEPACRALSVTSQAAHESSDAAT